jgi:hypothetical protein
MLLYLLPRQSKASQAKAGRDDTQDRREGKRRKNSKIVQPNTFPLAQPIQFEFVALI